MFNFAQTVLTTVSNLDAFRRLDAPFAPNARASPGWKTLAGVFF